ncbi:hypothetical protein MGA3_11030 [Bacillus methanolicus MGA3]|nr:hypothetical protein MGA3_11030 [Bacillus methanolicus MGA3]
MFQTKSYFKKFVSKKVRTEALTFCSYFFFVRGPGPLHVKALKAESA